MFAFKGFAQWYLLAWGALHFRCFVISYTNVFIPLFIEQRTLYDRILELLKSWILNNSREQRKIDNEKQSA